MSAELSPHIAVPVEETARAKIERFEALLLSMPQADVRPVHYFTDGFYAREITVPAGVTLTGKIHREGHINIISKGSIAVMTDDGMQLITAPCTLVSCAGIKRVGYAFEETVWTTIHANPTNTRDVAALEAALIEPAARSVIVGEETVCLG